MFLVSVDRKFAGDYEYASRILPGYIFALRYCIYEVSGPSLLIESTNSMIRDSFPIPSSINKQQPNVQIGIGYNRNLFQLKMFLFGNGTNI